MSAGNETVAATPSPTLWYEVIPEVERTEVVIGLGVLVVLSVGLGCWLYYRICKFERFTRTLEEDALPDVAGSGCAVGDESAAFAEIKHKNVYIIESDSESDDEQRPYPRVKHVGPSSWPAEAEETGGKSSLQTIELHEVNRRSKV